VAKVDDPALLKKEIRGMQKKVEEIEKEKTKLVAAAQESEVGHATIAR